MFFGKRHTSLIISILFLCSTTILTQDYDYIQYTTDDGLPTNYVYGVIEDDEGYIWAYTENGLAKFDGYTFKNFSVQDGLPNNDIVFAAKGKDGKIWLHPYKSKPTYIENDSIVVFSDKLIQDTRWLNEQLFYLYSIKSNWMNGRMLYYENGKIEYPRKFISSFFLEKNPDAFIFNVVRAWEPNWQEKIIEETAFFIHLTQDSIYSFSTKGDNNFTFSTDEGFGYYTMGDFLWVEGNKEKYFSIEGLEGFITYDYKNIGQLGQEDKYILNVKDQFYYILDIENEKLEQLQLPEVFKKVKRFEALLILERTVILSSQIGFVEYDFDGNIVDMLVLSELGEFFTLNTFFKDSKKNIWLGSREGGLFFIPNKSRTSQSIYSRYAKDKAFERLVSTSRGQLLGITDNSGIYAIDKNEIKTIRAANKGSRFRSAINLPSGILLSNATEGGLLIQERKSKLEVLPLTYLKSIVSNCEFPLPQSCCNSSQMLFRSAFSLSYDPNKDRIYHRDYGFYISEKELTNLKFTACHRIKNDIPITITHYSTSKRQLFLGSNDGIYWLDEDKYIPIEALQRQALLENLSTLYSTEECLWIGTENNGLFKYSFVQQDLKRILNVNNIRRIRPDTDSTLLLATNKGVYVIHQEKEEQEAISAHYSTLNGLFLNEIQDVHSSGEQYIYTANSDGIQVVDRTAKYISHLDKEDLRINGVTINELPIPLDTTYCFDYDENNINIQYHLMSMASNGKATYYTKLEPLEKEWIKTEARIVNYLDLSSGKYTFHLKAEDIYGNVVEHAPLPIEIKTAFWRTIWFNVLSALLALGVMLYIIYRRDKANHAKLQYEKRMNRRMAELELSALRAQMNPHFVFNALGAIQYHIQINEVEAADNYLTRFAKLMRKYLDSSKEKMLSLKQEVELLNIYTELEQLRFEDAFTVSINVADDISTEDVYLPSMLIQPFIENAINHGLNERRDKEGILVVQFYKKNKALHCEIKDNGVGRKNAKKNRRKGHKSRGMTIIKEKIQTLRLSGISDINITISDLYPGEAQFPGTHVTLIIKNLEDEDL